MANLWTRFKELLNISLEDKNLLKISLEKELTVRYGEVSRITANIIIKQSSPFIVNWQKVEDGTARTLYTDHKHYSGTTCDITYPELVINDTDILDAGVYQLEVVCNSKTTTSQQIVVNVYKDHEKEDNNYLRFYLLCQQYGTEAVRLYFIRHVPQTDLGKHLSQFKTDLKTGNYQLGIQKCTADQIRVLFPVGSIVKSTDFDFTLLYKLIRNTVKVSPPSRGWGSQPASTDTRETDDIERIHHARNKLAHNNKFTLSNAYFQTFWMVISKAINTLSRGSLNHEVNALFVKRFDRHERQEMIEDIKCKIKLIDDKIEVMGKTVSDTREQLEEVELRQEVIESRHIPVNVRETQLRLIQIWKEEDKVFSEETTIFKSAWNVITGPEVNLIFVGGPGCGKSATARHVALKLEEDHGYEVVPICNLCEIPLYTNVCNKQVFVLDDVLGIFSVDDNKYHDIESYKDRILASILTPSKIIFTCRRTVYNDALDLKAFVTDNCIDLESNDNKLTYIERIRIMKKHCIDEDICKEVSKRIEQDNDKVSPMFPLLCKLYASDPQYQDVGSEFFFKPVKHLLKELSKLRKLKKPYYATLILCLVNENMISRNMFPTKKVKKDVYNTCGLCRGTPDSDITDAIKQMAGTYLADKGTYYTFIHDSIFEVVACHYGKHSPEQIIKYMSSDFIASKIKLCGEVQDEDLFIKITSNTFQVLAERLYEDIESMELLNVFRNPALSVQPFLETFMSLLDQKPYHLLTDLFLSGIGIFNVPQQFFQDVDVMITNWRIGLLIDHRCSFFRIPYETRVIRWIVLFGHSKLLRCIVESTKKQNETKRVFGSIFETHRLLTLACFSKDVQTVDIILQNVNTKYITSLISGNSQYKREEYYYFTYNPVLVSCYVGDLDTVKLLVDRVGIHAIESMTYNYHLCIASEQGHYDVVKFLIDEGADVNRTDQNYKPPLDLSSRHGHTKIVQYLLDKGVSVDIGDSPLCLACQGGHIDSVKVLIKAGLNIEHNVDFQTPLCVASLNGHNDVVEYLVEEGADVNRKNTGRETPLYLSSTLGHAKIVKYLLDKGANVNKGRSPLCGTCVDGHLDVVKILVKAGSEINSEYDCLGSRYHGDGFDSATPLYYASKYGHYDVVKYLIEEGADVNKKDIKGKTPLYISSNEGHTEIVQYLIDKGATVDVGCLSLCNVCKSGNIDIVKRFDKEKLNIHQKDIYNITPISCASRYGHYNVVKYLIEEGADVNTEDNEVKTSLSSSPFFGRGEDNGSTTPLYWSSKNGHTKIVQYLLDKGASVTIGRSPLCTACEGGYNDIVKMLVKAGPNINQKDVNNNPPLFFASLFGHYELVKYLIEVGAEINTEDKNGKTPLYLASYKGHTQIVQYLLDKGALVNKGDSSLCGACKGGEIDIVNLIFGAGPISNNKNAEDKTHLNYVSGRTHYDVVKYLIEKGADVNREDKEGKTPLYWSSALGLTAIVQFLLVKEASVNVGCPPLCKACKGGYIDIVKMLIKAGSDINQKDDENTTPLCYASKSGHDDVVKYLIEEGADVNAEDKEGKTPLWLSSNEGHSIIVQYILEKGAFVNVNCSLLCEVCTRGFLDILKMLVKAGCNINHSITDDITPLWCAFRNHDYNMVNYLIEEGADVNKEDNKGNTVLYLASCDGSTMIVQYLLEKRASVHVKCSPLCGACKNGHIDIVKILVTAGSDTNQKDVDDKTPLIYASTEGYYDVVKYLVQEGADVNIEDKDGKTPIYWSSYYGKTEIVQYLLEKGASIQARSSPFCGESKEGNIDIF